MVRRGPVGRFLRRLSGGARARVVLLALVLLALAQLGAPRLARAASTAASTRTVTTVTTTTVTAAAGTPVLITDKRTPPAGYRLTALQALAIARRSPVVRQELRRHPRLEPYEYTKGAPTWQVSWFTRASPQRERLQVYVDDDTGRVTQAWTGVQVAWSMARGYPGAFGRIVNAWYLWLVLCLLFLAPFVPWRRRPGLLHLDLLVLLSFSVSLALFNHADIGLSTPLFYPPLIYLFVRLTLLGCGRGRPREPLRLTVPVGALAVGAVVLLGLRIALNIVDSNVIDVGFSGVIGADKVIHGVALYGHWPANDLYGDTYGPFNYFAYVPFRFFLGWSGAWDGLPAAHGASIFFDLATVGALFALGCRWRDRTLGIVLAYAWTAFPFTLWSLSSNTNDSLVALTVTLCLLALGSAPARGAFAALAGLTKFAPFILAPLLLRGTGGRPTRREAVLFGLAFAAIVVLCMLPVVLENDLGPFWHDSVRFQSDRVTPFSVWGLWGGLSAVQHALQGAIVAMAVIVAWVPRRRGPVEVAALAGALIVGLQMVTNYWLYSYIVWFLPAVLAALFAAHPAPGEALEAQWRALESRRTVPDGEEPAGAVRAPLGPAL